MIRSLYRRATGALLEQSWIGWSLAALLIAIAIGLGWQRETAQIADQSREVSVQARILGGSAAGALAFDDDLTVREYVNALRIDDKIRAAGIYGTDGRLVAGFTKDNPLPATVEPHPAEARGLQLVVVEPVKQGDLELGSVYLRTSVEPWPARLSRYAAIGMVILMAALLIVILSASNAAAVAANRRLQVQVDAREKAENALHQAQKMEALGQLTGGVAHDFNNLLMAASSGLELMDRARDPERREKLKAGVREALDHGARLTQHLLAFSRRTPLQKEVVSIASRIDKLANLLDRSLLETIAVRFDIAGDLWPIEVDVSQFDIAVLNIALNARDAMPSGGELRIGVRNRPGALDGKDAVEVRIEDQGTGMSPDAVAKAFEPFYTTKGMGQGTGLGLSQVYGFTRAAGGEVEIVSTPGEGTAVTMLFPRSHLTGAIYFNGAKPATPASIEGLKILLVEDDPALNDLVSQMLEELGSTVVRANCAAVALDIVADANVELVLSDMVMPGEMDGLDLVRELRKANDRLPVVLMTGYSAAAGLATDEGFSVLKKPFNFDALAARLAEAVAGGKRAQD